MRDEETRGTWSWLERAQLAGIASLGAGAIHLSAAGIHAEHPTLARVFVALGSGQILAGLALVLVRRRWAAATVVAVNSVAVIGWALTLTSGISRVDGLEVSEAPQFADTACAVLGAIAAALAAAVTLRGLQPAPRNAALLAPGGLVAAVSVAAMLSAATHVHDHDETVASAGHVHEESAVDVHVHPGSGTNPPETSAVDLSGVADVTPAQQQFAEQLVARTRAGLPQWQDPAVAEAAGLRSIGDASTGFEHYVQWDWLEDDVWLDPNHPESLVYVPHADGSKTLVSAMYMLPSTIALDDVPNWGGALMQWHVHDNLCYSADDEAPQVRGLTTPAGTCRPPLVKHPERPMIHVWIVPNECGPFASLEGIGAGTIRDGEARLCDHVHGS